MVEEKLIIFRQFVVRWLGLSCFITNQIVKFSNHLTNLLQDVTLTNLTVALFEWFIVRYRKYRQRLLRKFTDSGELRRTKERKQRTSQCGFCLIIDLTLEESYM